MPLVNKKEKSVSSKGFIRIIFLLSGMFSALLPLHTCADEESHIVLEQFTFNPVANPMADVDEAIKGAIKRDKLLLLVLGAQWCHDSRGLASRFSNEKLLDVIESKYHTVFVDVGYLQDRRNITQRFGYPSYFATPTVMVIEPKSEQLLNGDSMDIWAFAASIILEDYIDYFSDDEFHIKTNSELQNETFTAIQAFANKQAERLNRAYIKLSPMLAQSDAGDAPDEFVPLWKEVRRFRLALQKDIIELTKEANKTGTDSNLVFPEYAQFSWEQAEVSE